MLAPGLHLGGVSVNMSQVVMVCTLSVPGDLHSLECSKSRSFNSFIKSMLVLLANPFHNSHSLNLCLLDLACSSSCCAASSFSCCTASLGWKKCLVQSSSINKWIECCSPTRYFDWLWHWRCQAYLSYRLQEFQPKRNCVKRRTICTSAICSYSEKAGKYLTNKFHESCNTQIGSISKPIFVIAHKLYLNNPAFSKFILTALMQSMVTHMTNPTESPKLEPVHWISFST